MTAVMVKVALFPIPNGVTFPGSVFPLHVFEPRYRDMVHYCLEHDIPLGICHTQKIIRAAKQDQSLEEALQSNQATYKPHTIFSAGRCELLKTLGDGRLYLQVHITDRLMVERELQVLPFSIVECSAYEDMSTIDQQAIASLAVLQQKILKRLQVITNKQEEVSERLKSPEWVDKKPIDFSLAIFGLLQFDSHLQQQILEMTSPQQRLQYLLTLLNE